MKHIGLFEGIGGFSVAAHKVGWETVAWCEWNDFGQKVLKEHFPNAEEFSNIKTTDFTKYANQIDIITGGFPCQPYSVAGKRLGKDDDRHLWPEMLRAIREIKPRWVVAENVRGIVNWSDGLVFEEVQLDLENEGYQVQSFILPACAVDAPHRRDRIWIIAYSNSNGNQRRGFGENRIEKRESESQEDKWERIWSFTWGTSKPQAPANSSNNGLEHTFDSRKLSEQEGKTRRKRSEPTIPTPRYGQTESFADTSNEHMEGRPFIRSIESEWKKGNKQFTGNIPSTWQNFPTQPPLCSGNDGFRTELLRQRIREDCMGNISEEEIDKIISTAYSKWRKESLKSAGNAIVPQVAIQIFQSIIDFELNNPT